MERSSLAARSPMERLTRPLGGRIGLGRAWEGLAGRGGVGAGGLRGRSLRAPLAHRRLRYALIAAIVATPLLGGGWLWLRHSSFVAVQHVRIAGVHGPQAHQIQSALDAAARGMSTLDVKVATLRAAVARFPQVSELRAIPSFPHSLRIVVSEQPSAAALVVGGVRTAVAADGVVLGPQLVTSALPTVADSFEPTIGQHLRNPLVLQALTVLGAAPPALSTLAKSAYFSPRGLTVAMDNGLLIYFGDASRPHAKWLSLARVLADSTAAGATYVDVRLPERPAAGLREGAPSTEGSSNAESTVAALAESLKGKLGLGAETKAAPEGAGEAAGEGEASGREAGEAKGGEAEGGEERAREAGGESSEASEGASEPSG